MNKNNIVLLHLSLIYGIGPKSVLKFIKQLFDNYLRDQKNPEINRVDFDLTQIYDLTVNEFVHKFNFTKNQADLLTKGLKETRLLEEELSLLQKHKIDLLTILDQDYPKSLKEIYSPPVVIYCKGEKLKNYGKKIAIVGSRKATSYAQRVLKKIIPDLISNNFSIVSGGAYGVDTIAHKTAVEFEGKTIVVLGAGLLQPANQLNRNFFDEISKGIGTLVSPFPLLKEADKGTFPARNRIISGLSSGCLVVQAAKKSGALITAKFALDQGRNVFAVPGNIFETVSKGCHNLINQGAKLVADSNDILEEYGIFNKKEKKDIKQKKEKTTSKQNLILNSLNDKMSLDELSLKLNLCLD
ncbi:DNA-protecting protein DprA, partial [Candidatus Dependentiae bacterium]|nr:DNA-protecting protein DprA [Candidatus Dependentiae bacterium]